MCLDQPAVRSAEDAVTLAARDLSQCRHRVYLEYALNHDADDHTGTLIEHPGAIERKAAAAEHRNAVREELARGMDLSVVPPGSSRERAETTERLMRAGASAIWNATFHSGHGRRGHCELLRRVDQSAAHGGLHKCDGLDGGAVTLPLYVPIIVVNHKVLDPVRGTSVGQIARPVKVSSPLKWDPEWRDDCHVRSQPRDLMRLSHITRMMQAEGFPVTGVGGVIGVDVTRVLVHDLSEVLPTYDERLLDRLSVASGVVPSQAYRIGECRRCPWWAHKCAAEITERRDISLVMNSDAASVLREAGVTTVDDVAGLDGSQLPKAWTFGDIDEYVAIARAIVSGEKLVRRVSSLHVVSADVEVDVDMESYQDSGAYLWGTLLTDNVDHRPVVYRPFVTWDPLPTEDEARSFAEFWGWLMAERDAAHRSGKTFAAYCYSELAENRWLRSSAVRFAGYPAMPTLAEVNEFIASDEWVDIFEAVRTQFLSTQGKGLKVIAPFAGFSWRDSEANGEASMGWYRDASGLGGGPKDLRQQRRLLIYNEDDVRATKALREWIRGSATSETRDFVWLGLRNAD